MKLPCEFIRLPLSFDAAQLQQEVASLPEAAWVRHPTDFEGNSSVRLISVDGGQNDDVSGPMRPTPLLESLPYLQQVLASFGVVWSRSRLMRIAPGCGVPEHADINYHWFQRVRVHIPVVTHPAVQFHCGTRSVHMAAGEAWIFDNWRLHRVENQAPQARIHLVADTGGSAGFWQMVAESLGARGGTPLQVPFEAERAAPLFTERHNQWTVMPPGELEMLVADLCSELEPANGEAGLPESLRTFGVLASRFCEDWRQLWALYADTVEGWKSFGQLRDSMRTRAAPLLPALRARTNRIPAQRILEGRILRHLFKSSAISAFETATGASATTGQPQAGSSPPDHHSDHHAKTPGARGLRDRLDRPIIIVAAPRSGSSLLFETLACTPQLYTLGGEAHWLVEGVEALRPDIGGVESNRLTAAQCSAELEQHVDAYLRAELRDSSARSWNGADAIRFLEKTPKNALRIPLFDRLFPDALFVHLWRDPRENLGSIIEAWRSGRWVTYPRLPGREGAWSLLLPPGWRALQGEPLARIAAHQWLTTNRLILDDLRGLPEARQIRLSYADLVANPAAAIRRLCDAAELQFDEPLVQRVQAALPLAQHTLTPPQPDKWKIDEQEIESVLPDLQQCWLELRSGLSGAR